MGGHWTKVAEGMLASNALSSIYVIFSFENIKTRHQLQTFYAYHHATRWKDKQCLAMLQAWRWHMQHYVMVENLKAWFMGICHVVKCTMIKYNIFELILVHFVDQLTKGWQNNSSKWKCHLICTTIAVRCWKLLRLAIPIGTRAGGVQVCSVALLVFCLW